MKIRQWNTGDIKGENGTLLSWVVCWSSIAVVVKDKLKRRNVHKIAKQGICKYKKIKPNFFRFKMK